MGKFNVEAYTNTKNTITISDIGEDNIIVVASHFHKENSSLLSKSTLQVITKCGKIYISQRDFDKDFDIDRIIPSDLKFTEEGTVEVPEIPTVDIVKTKILDLNKDYTDDKSAIYLYRNNKYIPIIAWEGNKEYDTNYRDIAAHFNHEMADITIGMGEWIRNR